jgi:predicted small lipoprotein YifL
MRHITTKPWSRLLSSLFALAFLMAMAACGNDGPNTDIDTEDIIQSELTEEHDAGVEILDDSDDTSDESDD